MQLQMNLGQAQTISPQMIASMTVLQCGSQELGAYLENLSYENPMLDIQEPERTEAVPLSDTVDKLRWLQRTDRQNRSYYADTDKDSVDQYLHRAEAPDLTDFVKEQILTLDVSPALRSAMEAVAELLDHRGLFPGTAAEIAEVARCPLALAEEALERVRALEPPGVAAGSVQEALLRQLEDRPVAHRLVAEQFQHLGTWSDRRLARAMGVPEEAVRRAKADLAELSPYPGNGFASREEIQYVTPDLSIRSGPDGLTVTAEEAYLPTIRVNPEYLRMLETEQDPEVQRYLQGKLRQLEQVMGDLDRRKSTLLRCGEVIAARQAAFLQGGALGKLTLRDVAEELGLHESTISRAVKNKYVACDRGMLPMSAFFHRDVGQNVGLSRDSIQDVMRDIIRQEDPSRPLSDEKIVAELRKRHIQLSRRAVAKYRAELGIPPASARKGSGGQT